MREGIDEHRQPERVGQQGVEVVAAPQPRIGRGRRVRAGRFQHQHDAGDGVDDDVLVGTEQAEGPPAAGRARPQVAWSRHRGP